MACMQSKKRGLSLEEKRDKVLEIFHETKDVFQLKVSAEESTEADICPPALLTWTGLC